MNIESGKLVGGKGTFSKVASDHSYNVYNGEVSAVGMPHGSGEMKTFHKDDDTLIANYVGEFKDGSYVQDDDDDELVPEVPENVPLEPSGASPLRHEDDSDKNGVDPLARDSPESVQNGRDPSTTGSSPSTIGSDAGLDPSTGGSTTSDVSSNDDNQEGSPGSLGGLSTNNGGLSDSFQLDAAAAATAAADAEDDDAADDAADDDADDDNDNLSRPNSTPDSAEIHPPQIQTPLNKFRSLAISTTKNAASSVASNAPVLASSAANLAGRFANATLEAAKGVYAATMESSDEENQLWGPFARPNNGNVDFGGGGDDDDDDTF